MIFARYPTVSASLRALAYSAAVFCASTFAQPAAVDLGAAPPATRGVAGLPSTSARSASAPVSASSPGWVVRPYLAASAAARREAGFPHGQGAHTGERHADRLVEHQASGQGDRVGDHLVDQHHVKALKRDDLAPDLTLAIKDVPEHAVDLPGVLKLDGSAQGVLDPTRSRKISWTNEGSQTVYVSATDPNRLQLPFPNPRVIGTTDVDIDKRPNSSNVYVTFVAGVTHPVQVWFEPHEGSGASVGLLLVPKRIPAQSIQIVDDTGALAPHAARAEEPDDFLARVQDELQDALASRSPQGWSTVNVPVPPIVLDGVLVDGVRRLSSLSEDIYVYTVRNPGPSDVVLDESQFDGPRVEAVSILPSPLLHSHGSTSVAVLARKGPAPVDAVAVQTVGEGH